MRVNDDSTNGEAKGWALFRSEKNRTFRRNEGFKKGSITARKLRR